MFTQVDAAPGTSKAGLGIGLTLARQIVQMHGGTIRASSEGPGRGSEFTIRLPASPVHDVAGPAPAAPKEEDAPKMKIVIADDNRDSADSMAMLLEATGHAVHVAYDGAEAVATAVRVKPDAVLLDIGMPKMNGFECARAIRGQPWAAGTLLIALTGWGQEEDKRRALEAGFDRHLTKPVDPAMLENALRLPQAGQGGSA
jgi:CheY-like chemotaxis protein